MLETPPGPSLGNPTAGGSPASPAFPTIYSERRGKLRYLGPLPCALTVAHHLSVDPRIDSDGVWLVDTDAMEQARELLTNLPSAPGWSFADTTSPTPKLPRLGFPHSTTPFGTCGHTEMHSTPEGITLTGSPGPISAIFNDAADGLVLLGSDKKEHPAPSPSAAALLRAILNGREHLTVVRVGPDLTVAPLLRKLANCDRREGTPRFRVCQDSVLLT